MRVLVTGHRGYVGTLLTRMLLERGHEVVGLDSDLFAGCDFGHLDPPRHAAVRCDVRDFEITAEDRFDGVAHLAGISNDPLGDLDPELTDQINHLGSVRLAESAKGAGVPRFVFASSCSNYGAAGDDVLNEAAELNPVTPYGRSKVDAEAGLGALADARFSPTYLRGSTAYGVSPRLRGDLVVNNLVGHALTRGQIFLKSDGTPWRPLVHVSDLARAYVAALEAPREAVHDEAFNVGREGENYRVRQVAELVGEAVPEAEVTFAPGAGPDTRNYRVSFDKIAALLPDYRPRWTVPEGIRELVEAFRETGMSRDDLEGARYFRIARVRELLAAGELGTDLRWSGMRADSGAPPTTVVR